MTDIKLCKDCKHYKRDWGAETWYNEKQTEGKKPKLWQEETTTILRKLK